MSMVQKRQKIHINSLMTYKAEDGQNNGFAKPSNAENKQNDVQ